MKKAKVYTRTGDQGTSQLLSVGRVAKNHPRLVAYGDCDELNSALGVALGNALAAPLPEQLQTIQADLFVLGSHLAVPNPDALKFKIPSVNDAHTHTLEQWIDALDTELKPLQNFILPGGGSGAAQLHFARTICRRCERNIQALPEDAPAPAPVLTYINRLSDYLFTAARYENQQSGIDDIPWKS